jgi:hypothetical protein
MMLLPCLIHALCFDQTRSYIRICLEAKSTSGPSPLSAQGESDSTSTALTRSLHFEIPKPFHNPINIGDRTIPKAYLDWAR